MNERELRIALIQTLAKLALLHPEYKGMYESEVDAFNAYFDEPYVE